MDANPYLLDLLGYTLPEAKTKAIWEIGFFSDVVKAKEAFHILKTDRYVRYEDLPLEAKDGRQVPVEFVSNIYPEGSGMVIALPGLCGDFSLIVTPEVAQFGA